MNFKQMKVRELKTFAKEQKMRGYSRLTKQLLIQFIIDNMNVETPIEETPIVQFPFVFNSKYTNMNSDNLEKQLQHNLLFNKDLLNEINNLKTHIFSDIPSYKWKIIRTIVTKYEMIGNNRIHNIQKLHNIKSISRAYFKLWEILVQFEGDLNTKRTEPMRIAGLAEAPGGFIQCLVNYRKNKSDDITGISLKDAKNNKIDWLLKNPNVKIIYGDNDKNHDGNLYNPEILEYYTNYYKNNKADLVTSDGGFLLTDFKENYKEQLHMQLFLSETYTALKILKKGGHFIIKIYEICNKSMVDMLVLLEEAFEKIEITKPVTSREMNNEKYIVCMGYKDNQSTDYIKVELLKMLTHMWENKNELIIDSFLELTDNNNKQLENYKNVSNKFLNIQKNSLSCGINLKRRNMRDLKRILKNEYHLKCKAAKNWLWKNQL